MSGGVGPTCNDISLPKEEEEEKQHELHSNLPKGAMRNSSPRKGFFSFQQLNALAVIIILAASGMGPATDPPVFGPKNRLLGLYVFIAAVIGLFLPIAYIFEGIFEGDKEGIKAAAPHVYLLASQVFMEGLAFSGRFSIPIRAFVPIFYNSRRIFTIVEWLRSEVYKVDEEYGGSPRRLYIGRALAVANMGFWCFNLFGFLLPVYLPRAFRIYYSGQQKKMTD